MSKDPRHGNTHSKGKPRHYSLTQKGHDGIYWVTKMLGAEPQGSLGILSYQCKKEVLVVSGGVLFNSTFERHTVSLVVDLLYLFHIHLSMSGYDSSKSILICPHFVDGKSDDLLKISFRANDATYDAPQCKEEVILRISFQVLRMQATI